MMKKIFKFSKIVFLASFVCIFTMASWGATRTIDVVLGKDDALTVVEYSSLSCGGCAHFAKTFLPVIEKEFIRSGRIRLIIRSMVMTPEDVKATMLVCCHPDPHKLQMAYWNNQSKWVDSKDDQPIRKIAQEYGMTPVEIDACWADNQLKQTLFSKKLIALKGFDIKAIPTILINGKQYDVKTPEELRKVIEEVLKEDHSKKNT